jgi:3-oxoacyl-[acyl-carrier protein] reductase
VVGLLQPTYAVYAVTKAGVEARRVSSPGSYAGEPSRSTRSRPDPTATDLFLHGKPQEVINRLAKLAPLEHLGEPSDIAAAVAFCVF